MSREEVLVAREQMVLGMQAMENWKRAKGGGSTTIEKDLQDIGLEKTELCGPLQKPRLEPLVPNAERTQRKEEYKI